MDRDPANVVPGELDLAHVDAYAEGEVLTAGSTSNRGSASHGGSGGIEGSEKSVTGRHDPPSTEPLDRIICLLVVQRQGVVPRCVPEPCRGSGRVDDIGEQEGGEHAVRGAT